MQTWLGEVAYMMMEKRLEWRHFYILEFRGFCWVLIFSLVLSGCVQNRVYIYQRGEQRIVGEDIPSSKKSPFWAVMLSIFPGFLWHGLGHRYGGDRERALLLEQLEVYSLGSASFAAGLYFVGKETKVLGKGERQELFFYAGAVFFGVLGILIFLGTWFYDILYAPKVVQGYNAGE
ncbi:MAG: hypothetical protein D6805_10190 [Planctomycetota bacterium]|nr:MAG: hypothetical protein D6805_10190 [Planctomycetota bacterium]